MIVPPWLWIPFTIFAAAAQTVRNTAQRSLVDELGSLGATLVRFVYGMPFLVAYLVLTLTVGHTAMPRSTVSLPAGSWSQHSARWPARRYCCAPWPPAASRSAWSIPRAR